MKQLETVKLKNHLQYDEAWLQKQIAENPSILGLGDLRLRAKEKILTYGRLDILLEDSDTDNPTRYEVEVQLGDTDESHIIRTIEYWDLERKRYPQYEHVAVLVAEGVTSRFLNVLNLFNGHIPLIVLKLDAFKVDDDIALHFTRILDRVQLGMPEEEETVELTNRSYWEKKTPPETLKLIDGLFSIVQSVDPDVSQNYNKYYIGLLKNNVACNYCTFEARKAYVLMKCWKMTEPSQDLLNRLDESGVDVEYKAKWRLVRFKFSKMPTAEQLPLVKEVIELGVKSFV